MIVNESLNGLVSLGGMENIISMVWPLMYRICCSKIEPENKQGDKVAMRHICFSCLNRGLDTCICIHDVLYIRYRKVNSI